MNTTLIQKARSEFIRGVLSGLTIAEIREHTARGGAFDFSTLEMSDFAPRATSEAAGPGPYKCKVREG